jgi:outer membrane receptor protein involved in Fe transport
MARLTPAATFKALALGTALIAFLPTAVLAQSSDVGYDEAEPLLEEVIVTGTRIKRVDVETAVPVTIIDREIIDKSGYMAVSELLRASVLNTLGTQYPTPGSDLGGAATVDLRGLGPANTLVLLNGRRLAPFPVAGAESQDLNQIPMDAVERIEILRDGASAIYGSDAIAGVVNIITRKDMRDVILSLQLEDRDPDGGEGGQASLTGGHGWDGGNLTYSLGYFRQDPVFYRDVPRLSNPPAYGNLSYSGFPATALLLGGPLPFLALSDPRCPSNQGESADFPNAYRWNWYDVEAGSGWLFESICSYNWAVDQSLQPKIERYSVYLDGRHELNDKVRLVASLLYSHSEAEHTMAAAALENFPLFYTADNPVNPLWLYIGQTVTDPGLAAYGVPDGTWTFSEDDLADVFVMMRTVPNGNRILSTGDENTSFFAGLEGEQSWLGGGQWNLGLEFASSRVRRTIQNLVNLPGLQQAMDSGALDLFNVQGLDHETWLADTFAAFASVNGTSYYSGDTEVWTVDGMLDFEGFQLGGGPVPVVVGFEYRDLTYDQGTDPETRSGDIGGWFSSPLIESAVRQVTTVYAEALLPLGSRVDLDLAARYDHYSDFGNTTNPKVSLAWRPGRDWLLRATWGTGFRAPNMLDLFAPRQLDFADAVDYVGCANGVAPCQRLQYATFSGGNPDLDTQESESWTAGAVWNATDHLALELTYYDIEFTNAVQEIDTQEMFRRERDGLPNTVVRKPDGTVDYVDATLINLSSVRTTGIDFSANYTLKTERAGLFDLTLTGTYVLSAENKWQENEPYFNFVDYLGIPRTRANFIAGWTRGAFQATWVTHYIDENSKAANVCVPGWAEAPCEEGTELFFYDAFWTHDLQLAWTASWNGQFALGAQNLFNETSYHDCCYGTKWALYDPIGRRVYLRYRQEF